MGILFNTILTIIITASLQAGMLDATEITPQQAAAECMDGVVAMEEETMDRYAANSYVNFVENLKGDEETVQRMRDALQKNLIYRIDGIEERNDAAMAKVTVTQCDFSKVLKKYEKEAYQYITEHLYDEDITDKKKLNAKCLDIYASQIEKVAKAGKTSEETIYLPMHSDGYNGWNVELDEESMKVILGNLAIPEDGLKSE